QHRSSPRSTGSSPTASRTPARVRTPSGPPLPHLGCVLPRLGSPTIPGRFNVMAAALIDRLLHHCHVVNIRGQQLPHEASIRAVADALLPPTHGEEKARKTANGRRLPGHRLTADLPA